jgi:hypothetical protein
VLYSLLQDYRTLTPETGLEEVRHSYETPTSTLGGFESNSPIPTITYED